MVHTSLNTSQSGCSLERSFYFPRGLSGLKGCRHYNVKAIPGNEFFILLQPVELAPLELILVDPLPFFPDYDFTLRETDRQELEASPEQEMVAFTTVSIDGNKIFTNLAAPIVFHVAGRRGKQIILPERSEQIRTPLIACCPGSGSGAFKNRIMGRAKICWY